MPVSVRRFRWIAPASFGIALAALGTSACGGAKSSATVLGDDAEATLDASSSGDVEATLDASSSSDVEATVDAAADAGGEADATPSCPASLPATLGACSPNFLTCEYGGNAHGACTTTATCACATCGGPGWLLTGPAPGCGQNAAACPASYGTGEGEACPSPGSCDYAEGRCGCLSCATDAGVRSGYWHCRAWDDLTADGCPPARPLIGTACGVPEGTTCDYDECCRGPSLGPSLQCTGGVWVEAFNGGCACAIAVCPG